jgi:hypothetical protein
MQGLYFAFFCLDGFACVSKESRQCFGSFAIGIYVIASRESVASIGRKYYSRCKLWADEGQSDWSCDSDGFTDY